MFKSCLIKVDTTYNYVDVYLKNTMVFQSNLRRRPKVEVRWKNGPKVNFLTTIVQVLDFTVVLHRGRSIRNIGYTWDKSCTVPQSSYRNQTIKTILTDLFPQTITHCTTKIAWTFENTTYK